MAVERPDCGPIALPYIRHMARFLVILGLLLVAAGLLWPWLGKLGLGRLPGDIWIERDNLTVVIPLGTSLLLSVGLSLILWLIGR